MPENTTTGETAAPAQAPASDSYSVHAALRPNKVALIGGERSLTYAELNARANRVGNALKGLLFGTILATISCAFMIPRVYFPSADVGFFSYNLGWQLLLAVFVWHWVYGLHLGMIYNPSDRDGRAITRNP